MHFNLLNAPVQINVVLGSIWIAIVSEIYKHRIKRIFKGGVIDHSKMFTLDQLKVCSWVTSKSVFTRFTNSELFFDHVACMFSIK